jgi:hypothetical protein
VAAATGTVAGYRGPRRKKLQQRRNACLPEADDDGLERDVIGHLFDRSTIPTGPILENAPVGGKYESGTQTRVEHESVMLSQKWVIPAIGLRVPKC